MYDRRQRGANSEVLSIGGSSGGGGIGSGSGGEKKWLVSMNGVAVHGNPCHSWMEYAIGGGKSRRDLWRVRWEFLPSMDGRNVHEWQDSTNGMHH